MKVALVCGGTGGHLYPGLATARVLRRRGHDVALWLAGRGVETHVVDAWDGPTVRIPASGFASESHARKLASIGRLLRAALRSRKELKASPVDIMLAMGSYASVGPALAAWMVGIPTVLHEANAVPGRAISFLARFSKCIGITFPAVAALLPSGRTVLTGLPLFHVPDGTHAPRNPGTGPLSILVMGGSQGSHHLNRMIPAALSRVKGEGHSLEIVHIAGDDDHGVVEEKYRDANISCRVLNFTKDMPELYRNADIAICRSGAATCMELAAFGVPALMVPYPHASRDHQLLNAQELEAIGAVRVLEQRYLTIDAVTEYIGYVIEHPHVIATMREAMSDFGVADADERLADLVERFARRDT